MGRAMSRGLLGGTSVRLGACFFWAVLVAVACVTSAQAEVGAPEVREYQKDFGVSERQAEDALEIQDRANAAGLAGGLEERLGQRYAGIWFDNEKGEYVVPTLPSTGAATVDSELTQAGLTAADFRISSARSSWAHLNGAQHQIDATLFQAIGEGFIDTSLDPRTNAVAITQTSGASTELADEVRQVAGEAPVEVDVRPIGLARFDGEPEACADPFCSAPLRGGVQINPPGKPSDHCTAGFPAIGTNGGRYLVTAGHCVELYPGAPLNLSWESKDSALLPHYIGKAEAWEFKTFDWAKINASGSEWDVGPWSPEVAYWGEPILNSNGAIIGKTPPVNLDYPIIGEAANIVGNYACHSGIITGTTCGYISGVNVSHTKTEHITYGLNKLANACASPGDSGGPYFMGHRALGLHFDSQSEQKICGDTLYYTDIQKATAALNVSIVAQIPPTVQTTAASNLIEGQATVNGSVDPKERATTYYFQYGPTTSYGSTTSSGNAGSGWGPISVSATIPNLEPGGLYHYRLVATNSSGTSYGEDRTFQLPISLTGSRWAIREASTGAQWVYYRGSSGQLCVQGFVNGSGWSASCLGGQAMASGTSPTVIRDGASGAQWVYYTGSNNQLCSAGFTNGSGWSYACLGGQAIASGTSPTAIREASTGAQWVYYTGSNSQPCSAGFVNGSGWSYTCLSGQAVATGTSPTAIREASTGAQWVYYMGSNSQVCALSFVNGTGWESACL
jgi:hypothetical protein